MLIIQIHLRASFLLSVLQCVQWFIIGDLMHEISNDGARDQFESLLATVIVPAMIKCARVCMCIHTCMVLCTYVFTWVHTRIYTLT